jgi:hypothetical protein
MSNVTVDIVAVDPLALFFRNDVYVKLHSPDPPPIEALVERLAPVVAKLDVKERQDLRSRAKLLAAHAIAIEKALGPE